MLALRVNSKTKRPPEWPGKHQRHAVVRRRSDPKGLIICRSPGAALWAAAPARPQKITLGEMRSSGVRGLLVYCADYHCSHSIAISADQWPEHLRLSDLASPFVCTGCGRKGADVRPDFHWNGKPVPAMGYR